MTEKKYKIYTVQHVDTDLTLHEAKEKFGEFVIPGDETLLLSGIEETLHIMLMGNTSNEDDKLIKMLNIWMELIPVFSNLIDEQDIKREIIDMLHLPYNLYTHLRSKNMLNNNEETEENITLN